MTDMLDVAPTLPRYGEEGDAALLQGRRPGVGEYLGANVDEGWWGTVPGVVGAMGREVQGERADPTPLSREEWEASGYARLLGPAWDERMTRGRAAAQARTYDENTYRRALMDARDPSAFEAALGFGGQLVGSLFDPVNFLPIGGPLERGLNAVGAVRAASVLARPGIAGSALRATVEAVGGNALAAPGIYAAQAHYGEEITFDRVLADLAIGAVIGAGFGTASGLLSRRVQMDASTAVRTVDAAAADVAAGRSVEIPSALATRAAESAVLRAAPQEMAGLGLADLPAGVGGAPMTRAEFDAWATEAGRGPPVVPEAAPAREAPPARTDEAMATLAPEERAIVQEDRARAPDQPQNPLAPAILEKLDAAERALSAKAGPEAAPMLNGESPAAKAGDAPSPDSLIPAGAERAPAPDAAPAPRVGEVAPAAAPAPAIAAPQAAAATREAIGADTYAWYREALQARQSIERMAAAPPARESVVQNPTTERNQRVEQPGNSGGLPGPEAAHIETMRAEGRLTAADEAILRAGDEQAAELQGVAKGLKEAGECLLRNMA